MVTNHVHALRFLLTWNTDNDKEQRGKSDCSIGLVLQFEEFVWGKRVKDDCLRIGNQREFALLLSILGSASCATLCHLCFGCNAT